MKKLRIIIPCYNEELNVPVIYSKLKSAIKSVEQKGYWVEYLFIDDGSTDNTENSISLLIEKSKSDINNKIRFIQFSRNFGKESAMMAGIDDSLEENFDAVIFVDADGQDNPDLISQMVEEWENGYNDIYAKRIKRENAGWFEKFSTNAFYFLLNYSSRINIPEKVGDFRLLDRNCMEAISRLREQNRYTKGIFAYIGFKKKAIYFNRPERTIGTSKWNLMRKLMFALDAFVGFSSIIYKAPFILGICIMACCIGFGLYDAQLILDETNHGIKKFIFFLFLFGNGMGLFFIGVVLKILFMILDEVRGRPQYIIQKKI